MESQYMPGPITVFWPGFVLSAARCPPSSGLYINDVIRFIQQDNLRLMPFHVLYSASKPSPFSMTIIHLVVDYHKL